MTTRDRVSNHRRRMRAQGLRPVQIWVPDMRRETFTAEAARQAALVADAERNDDTQDFIEAVAASWGEE